MTKPAALAKLIKGVVLMPSGCGLHVEPNQGHGDINMVMILALCRSCDMICSCTKVGHTIHRIINILSWSCMSSHSAHTSYLANGLVQGLVLHCSLIVSSS